MSLHEVAQLSMSALQDKIDGHVYMAGMEFNRAADLTYGFILLTVFILVIQFQKSFSFY